MKPLNICVDFDGTCVAHEYPDVGPTVPGAVEVQRELVAAGHRLILFTMRSDAELKAAQDWYAKNGIALYGVQCDPAQRNWTSSPKAYGNIYIDDAALGCPLALGDYEYTRPFVDWRRARVMLVERGVLA